MSIKNFLSTEKIEVRKLPKIDFFQMTSPPYLIFRKFSLYKEKSIVFGIFAFLCVPIVSSLKGF